MSGISNYYNNGFDYSGMYGSSSNSSNNGLLGISLTDYASIRNGSYSKLLKATYAQKDEQEKATKSATESKNMTAMKSGAEALKNSTAALTDHKLWEKKKIKEKNEETGEVTEKLDYDRDAIAEAVKNFVKDYNSVISTAGSSDDNSILRSATRMIKDSEVNSKLLKQVGITIGDDNKLTVDEDKLKEASIGTLKTLFEGSGSYADQISQRASTMNRVATEATDTYNSEGKYTNSAASAILSGNTSDVSGIGSTSKATYQISDKMKSAILDQVKLDYYMYGGSKNGINDTNSYKTKVNDYLNSLDSKNRSAASNTITKLREELGKQVEKQIKAQIPGWNSGNSVPNSVLDKVFADDNLMKNAEAVIYNGGVNVGV